MRYRLGAAALCLTVLFAATACGGGDDPVVSDPPPPVPGDVGAPGQPIPVEPDGGIGDGKGPGGGAPDPATARKVEPYEGGTVDTRARPWEQVVPNADQTELTVFWSSGVEPCVVLDRVEVEETEDAVTITVFEGAAADQPDAMCIQIAEYRAYTVELEGELGPRSILDGAA